MSDAAKSLMDHDRAFLIAPAGCGKTQTIAEMVALSTQGVQLILTHTHAGVQSLRNRLNRLKVNRKCYELDTIAGWALRIVNHYPQTADFVKRIPEKDDYPKIYMGAVTVLCHRFMQRVVQESYSGVIVDEYQDCTKSQHELILVLAGMLPCRILGDPLQGIFNFGKNDLPVDWELDIRPHFESVEQLREPYRWQGKNEQLGAWLLSVREKLERGDPISWEASTLRWKQSSDSCNRETCFSAIREEGTIVAIHPDGSNPHGCHRLAQQLKGNYQSIEPMEAGDLMAWAGKLDSASGNQRAMRIIEFAAACITAVSTSLKTIKDKFEISGTPDFSRVTRHADIALKLVSVARQTGFNGFVEILRLIHKIDNAHLYRADLWYGMLNALKLYSMGEYPSLKDAAWHSRQREKFAGRREFPRIVSRTLLIKGLEYDHAIVLDADKFNVKNLYVALTRGSHSLTIISSEPRLSPQRG
ncbi:MAG: AAA family ATPase [Anaerolinea sp.]|nr:AAA family ATPase [Anaerolinea sp.]